MEWVVDNWLPITICCIGWWAALYLYGVDNAPDTKKFTGAIYTGSIYAVIWIGYPTLKEAGPDVVSIHVLIGVTLALMYFISYELIQDGYCRHAVVRTMAVIVGLCGIILYSVSSK